MAGVLIFLGSVFVVSFSGAIAPGPVTATTISLGVRQKYAGAMLAIGHGIIEVPLILLIVSGAGNFLKNSIAQMIIGFAGGAVLLLMGVQMLKDARRGGYGANNSNLNAPVIAGIVLSASNPYFLIWWITVGAKFVTKAAGFGWAVVVMFIFAHWLSDLVWFQMLSFASNKGAKIMSDRKISVVLSICAVTLILFGGYFFFDTFTIT